MSKNFIFLFFFIKLSGIENVVITKVTRDEITVVN